MTRYAPLLALALLACDTGESPVAPRPEIQQSVADGRDFVIFSPGWFSFHFGVGWVEDLEPRADSVYGSGRWVDGDRVGYNTAYAVFQHQDPGNHGPVDVLRVSITNIADGTGEIVNDKFMQEIFPGGSRPYPYETEPINGHLTDKQGGNVCLLHQRERGGRYHFRQLLMCFQVPSVSPENPALTWWYQRGGEFYGVVGGQPVLSMQFSGMHSGDHASPAVRYDFFVDGIASPTWPVYRDPFGRRATLPTG